VAPARFVAYSEISPSKRVQSTDHSRYSRLATDAARSDCRKTPDGKDGHDKYTRTLADVLPPDGMSLNQELVKQGWC